MGVKDRRGDAAHAFGAFLVVDGKAAVARARQIARQRAKAGDGQRRELFQPLPRDDRRDAVVRMPGQQRLADAAGMHRPLGAGRKEGADRLVRFDLGQEQHLAPHLDPQVRGFARVAHQAVHRLAGAFHDLGPTQKGGADAKGARPDVPKLAGLLDLHHRVGLQGLQRAERGGDGLARLLGQVRKAAPRRLRQMFQKVKRPVQRLHRVLVGLVGERLWPPARFLCHDTPRSEVKNRNPLPQRQISMAQAI